MDNANIFDEFDPGINPPAAQPAVPSPLPSDQSQNMFDEFDPDKQQSDDSGFSLGALTRSAVRSVLPAVAGFAAAGGGAEVGSEVGAGIGAGVGSLGAGAGAVPGAAIGGVAGGIIGGVGAGIVGSYAASTAQDYGLKALPDSWQDFLGQSEEQQQSDIKLHPLETFTGGLVPYLLTMSPFAGAAVLRSLPQNATAFQRIAANPVTGRLFSGAVMGGMELGNEAAQGQPPDWRNIAISTGFGVVFNRPNRLGERITEIGAAPARRFVRGAPAAAAGAEAPAEQPAAPEATPAAQPNAPVTAKDWNEAILGQAPTVAQAADAKVMGPGITEDVFMGAHEQAPDAAMSAQDQVRAEAPAQPAPDLHATARAMHPELFGEYDNLAAQRDDLRAQIARLASPADEDIQSTEQARDALQEQLDAHLAARGGYAGGAEARGLRAKLRDAQSQFDDVIGRRDAFAAGEGTETPDMAALRQHLMATDFQMRDLAPQVAAAYRRAADFTSHPGIIEPEAPSQAPEAPIPTPEAPSGAGTAPSAPSAEPAKSIDAQVASIAQQVAAELMAAGRPADEARANGQLIAQRYRTRAARLNDALGGPEDLYRAEGPVIRGVGANARAFHPSDFAQAIQRVSDRLTGDAEAIANFSKRHTVASENGSRIPVPSSVLYHVVNVASLNDDILRSIVRSLPVDVVDLFARKKFSPEVALRNQSMLKDVFSVDLDSPVSLGVDPSSSARSLLSVVANAATDAASDMRGGAGEHASTVSTNEGQAAGALGHNGSVNDGIGDGKPDQQELFQPAPPIDTPEFNRWFGDSKVVDEYGAPLVVYHATSDDIDQFKLNKLGTLTKSNTDNRGAYNLARLGFWSNERPLHEELALRQSLPLFLKIEHPYQQHLDSLWAEAETYSSGKAFRDDLQRRGYDGIVVEDREFGGTSFVAFDPTQIKSTANRGTFDPNDPRILFQKMRGGIVLNPNGVAGRDMLGGEGTRPIIRLAQEANASTFIHESAHQWLAELMRDATHPAANDSLRGDAQTVKSWLGMEGETIKTRQHEKFARGFEQYMREGVAPSPGLARVFAQFKSWLVQIYQSIKGLGSPINDDIRSVFDRMLSEEPNRTVVTPEREAAPGIADIHATDAATIDPHEAEPAMDRVIAERDRYVSEQPPEVQNELVTADAEQRAADAAANAGTEAGAVAGGPAEVAASGVEPQPQPAGGAGSGERGPIIGGGGTAGPEGNGISGGSGTTGGADTAAGLREQRSEPAGGPRTQPLSPEPTTLFGPEQSPFIDRAGNIRVENLTSDADVAQAIHDAADQNNDFIGDRRGVITDGQVIDLADALGMDARDLSRRQLGEAFNAEQIIAARKLLIQSATDVVAAMKKAATGSDTDVLAYAQIKAKHQMIQGQVSGLTAEAGRALRAFRSLAGQEQAQGLDQFLRTATGKTLFQLKEEAKLGAQLDTPAKVSKFVRDGQKRTFGRMVLEYWINGLISGPATHTTYMVGNLILSLEKAGPETAAAALIGRLRNAMGREGETVRMGEVGAQLRGAVTSLPMATKAAIDSMRTGVTTRLPGETAKSMPFQQGAEFAPSAMLDETMSYAEVAPRVYGAIRGLRDGLISAGALVKAGGVAGSPLVSARFSPLGSIPDIAVRGVPVVPLGTAIRLPGRFVAAIHSFFRATNYSMAKNALAYRAASEAGLTGDAFDAKVADIRQNPTPQMMEDARATATNLTLMGQGSEFVQALGRLTNAKVLGFPLLKFIDPFVHIAGNILDQSIVQRTPLGLLAPEIRADLSGKNGNIAQDTASARMLVGTAITITFGSLAAQGLMSGSGPSDPQQAAMWRLAGNQAHSIRIGDVWYDVHRLGPMGMLGSMAADMYDVAHAASAGDFGEAAAGVLHAFTQTVLDEGFMSGPSELIQALEDPGRYGASYVRNQLASFVPYSVAMQQMDRASDPYSRQAKSIVDALKNKVPGLSETLTPRRDVWGNEIPNLPAFGGRMLSAILMQQVSNDPVNQAMLSLGIYPASVERKIRGVQLTDQQYDDYSRIAGRMTKQRLDTIVRSQAWGTWTPTVRHDVLLETIRQSRETARGIVMMKNPSIISAATQAKLAPFQEVTP